MTAEAMVARGWHIKARDEIKQRGFTRSGGPASALNSPVWNSD